MLTSILARWEKYNDFNFYRSILAHQYNFVFQHSERVAKYAVMLAKKINCSEEETAFIGAAALLHDLGKINVPIKILYKQGSYNENDIKEMEKHSAYGAQILQRLKDLAELVPFVQYHHERYDGQRYQQILKGERIPLPARIIHIAGAFDVMTTIQNYQPCKNIEEALLELKLQAGKQFDPNLVVAFTSLQTVQLQQICPYKGIVGKINSITKSLSAEDIVQYMANISNLGLICLDKNNTVVFCNPHAEKMRRMPSGKLLGNNFLYSYPQHRRVILGEKLAQLQSGERTQWYRLMGRKGRFIENRYSRVSDANGDFMGTVLVTIDVTEREKITRSLNLALERQAALYQAVQIITSTLNINEVIEGILTIIKKNMVTKQATISLVNENSDDILLVEANVADEKCLLACRQKFLFLQRNLKTLTITADNKIFKHFIPLVFKKDLLGILYVELSYQAEDDKERLELLETLASETSIAIHNAKLHKEIIYLAEYDKLTGLLNRHSFDRRFNDYCCRIGKDLRELTLLMIDINGLKKVNDYKGHVAGDMLIRECANIIQKSIRSDDCAFRYGGDEIVVLLPNINLEQAQIIIKRMQRNAKQWKVTGSYSELALSISIGAAESGEVEIHHLIQEADKRMYENKKKYYKSLQA